MVGKENSQKGIEGVAHAIRFLQTPFLGKMAASTQYTLL